MMKTRVLFASLVGLVGLAQPAMAGRTVIDLNGGSPQSYDGYCSPNDPDACAPKALGFTLTIAGVTYSHYVLNGNGALSLATSASPTPAPVTGVTGNSVPVFAAVFNDDPLSTMNFAFDSMFVAQSTSGGGVLQANWGECLSTTQCNPMQYLFSLTKLADGFEIQLSNMDGSGGFSIPGGTESTPEQQIGTQKFRFDANGQLTADVPVQGVPEPATWAMMMLGFGAMGAALRRRSAAPARFNAALG